MESHTDGLVHVLFEPPLQRDSVFSHEKQRLVVGLSLLKPILKRDLHREGINIRILMTTNILVDIM
jgi:hypothetical protein